MKPLDRILHRLRGCAPVLIATTAVLALSAALVSAAESSPPKSAKPDQKPAKKKKFTGAELYAMHCNRCHPERYPTERTAAQWKTLLTHMRVRANLPAAQAKEILKYLQEESGK